MDKFTIVDKMTCFAFSALPAFFLLFGMINKDKWFQWEEETYPNVDNRLQSIYWKSDYSVMHEIAIAVALILFIVLAKINNIFIYYVGGMMENLETVTGIIIGLTGFAFSMAVAVLVFDKNYYIVFSIKDVLIENKFSYWMKWAIIYCFCACIMSMTLLDYEMITLFDHVRFIIFEIAVMYNLFCTFMVYHVVWKIMFSDNSELKLLRKLYRVHELGNIDYSQMKKGMKWEKEAVEKHLDYLFEDYRKQCINVKTKDIENIELVFTPKVKKDIWNEQVRNRYMMFVVCFVGMGLLINTNLCIIYNEKIIYYLIAHIAIGIINCLLIALPVPSFKEGAFFLIWEKWGFCIDTGKYRFVTCRSYQIINKKYVRYLQSYGSLTGFIKVLSEEMPWIEENAKNIKEILKRNILKISDDIHDVVGMLSIFVIGYIQFKKGVKMKCVKDVYHKLDMTDEMKIAFKEMFYDYITYMDKDKAERKTEDKYLKWLSD